MSSIVIWFLCGLAVVSLGQARDVAKYVSACKTPNNEPGQCIALRKCPPLHAIVLNKTIAPAAVHFLHQSECGFVGRFRIFCCANEYSTATPWLVKDDGAATDVVTRDMSAERGVQEATKSEHEVAPLNHKDTPTTLSPFSHPNRFLLPTTTCGRQEVFDPSSLPRIGEQPWVVLLQYQNGNGDSSFSCGGVLISQRYVLTAAHCTSAGNARGQTLVSVRLGEHNLATESDCEETDDGDEFCGEPAADVAVELEIPHPGYTVGGTTTRHDIALIRLEPHVLTNLEEVIPICLPISDEVRSQQQNDDIQGLFLAGWGIRNYSPSSSIKLSSPTKVLDHASCASFYASRDVSSKSQLCTMAESCAGDNGGGVVSRANDGRYYVAGVASYGTEACGVKQTPVVFTRVAQYTNWILDQLRP